MSSDQPSRRPAGKAGGGAPMGSTVSIVIAVVAVVVGFLVLRNINDNGGDTTSAGNGTPNTDVTGTSADIAGTATTAAVPAETGPPTTPPLNTDPAQAVIVANASGLGGAAGRYTTALQGAGFTVGKATNGVGGKLALSVVYFLPGGEGVAASVAQAMGSLDGSGVVAAAMPTPPPVTGGTMPAGATVLVMLGTDRADKALPILAGTTATTLPAAPIDNTTTTSAP